jgi:hypothetical protein
VQQDKTSELPAIYGEEQDGQNVLYRQDAQVCVPDPQGLNDNHPNGDANDVPNRGYPCSQQDQGKDTPSSACLVQNRGFRNHVVLQALAQSQMMP